VYAHDDTELVPPVDCSKLFLPCQVEGIAGTASLVGGGQASAVIGVQPLEGVGTWSPTLLSCPVVCGLPSGSTEWWRCPLGKLHCHVLSSASHTAHSAHQPL